MQITWLSWDMMSTTAGSEEAGSVASDRLCGAGHRKDAGVKCRRRRSSTRSRSLPASGRRMQMAAVTSEALGMDDADAEGDRIIMPKKSGMRPASSTMWSLIMMEAPIRCGWKRRIPLKRR